MSVARNYLVRVLGINVTLMMESMQFQFAVDQPGNSSSESHDGLSTKEKPLTTNGRRVAEATAQDRELVIRLLKQLPQGQLDWENEVPECDPAYIYDRLTLSEVSRSSRSEMTWESLLQTLASRRLEFPDNDLYQLVVLSTYLVALKCGAEKDVLDRHLAQAIRNSAQTLKFKLHAVLKCLAILAILEESLGTRAAEVPLRVSILSICQKITWEGVQLVKADTIFQPTNIEHLARLKPIPELIYDLSGGRIQLTKIKSYLQIDITEFHEMIPGINPQLHQDAVTEVLSLQPAYLRECFYTYGQPEPCRILGETFLRSHTNNLQSIAYRYGKKIKDSVSPVSHARAYRMDAPGAFWAKYRSLAVVIPLFNGSVDVELISQDGHPTKARWDAKFVLCYSNMCLHVKQDNVRFLLYFYRIDSL